MDTSTSATQLLHCLIHETYMSFSIETIEKIIPLAWLTKVPKSPNYYAGLLLLGDRPVPIIDLAFALKLNREQAYTSNMTILLLSYQHEYRGIIVDKLLDLTEEIIHVKPEPANPFCGTFKHRYGVTHVLSIAWIFSLPLVAEDE